jgi:toxin ParE1/3/4
MSRYFLSTQAKYDLREIKNYIARDNLAAARRFVESFRDLCNLIAKSPRMGRSYEELASWLRGFAIGNYIIFYRPIENGIAVERLLSGYRDLELSSLKMATAN